MDDKADDVRKDPDLGDEESDEDEEVSRIMSVGEKSDDDDDDEEVVDVQAAARPNRSCVVTGEASESDDEEEEEVNLNSNKSPNRGSVPSFEEASSAKLRSDRKNSMTSSQSEQNLMQETKKTTTIKFQPVKYKTLLHKKLRERNISLQSNIAELVCHPFRSATNEINGLTQQFIKTQLLIQDLAPTLRQLTNDLFFLEDKIDFAHDCSNVLPEIAPEMKTIEM